MRLTPKSLSDISVPVDFATLERFARFRSRYLLHGVVAFVGIATVSSIALHPRAEGRLSTPASSVRAADPSSPSTELDLAALPMQAADAAAENSPADNASAPDAAAPASASATADASAPTPAKPIVHTVEEGETLRDLADRYGVNAQTIVAANGLRNPDLLQVGQDLVILPTDGVLYTLKDGESIRGVADHFGVDATDIVKANDLGSDPNVVQPGKLLVVPGATPEPAGRSAVVVHNVDGEQQIASVGGSVELPVDATAQAVPSTRTYEVQAGDTLLGIATTFGVDVQTMLSSNGIDDPDTIKPGSELRILPVKGVEYTVQPSETLADISWRYQVDLGLLLDYNNLDNPDVLRVGTKLVLPDGKLRADAAPAPAPIVEAPAAAPRTQVSAPAVVQVPAPKPVAAAAPAPKPVVAAPAPAPKPAAAAPAPAPKPAAPAPQLSTGDGGASIVANAMKYVGYRYVFGGTSPSGFDCSGFVYYIHNHSGAPVGRGMWQQYNGGAHISVGALQPGDTVFFANTYMPGLSHDGIYIGGGQFIHAADESTGVTISSMNTSYWQGHYVGATRLWD